MDMKAFKKKSAKKKMLLVYLSLCSGTKKLYHDNYHHKVFIRNPIPGEKNVQLVSEHYFKKSWNAVKCILVTPFKPVLQQIGLLQVVWILTSYWIKLNGRQAIHRCWSLVAKQVCYGPVKRATCTDFVEKVEQLTTFCNNFSQSVTTRFDSGWFVGGNNA